MVAAEGDLAQPRTRAAGVDQLDIGETGLRVDAQLLAGELAAEEAEARRLVLDQPLGVVVGAVVELRAGLQRIAVGNLEALQLRRRAFHADHHRAQAHRLAGGDVDAQGRLLAVAHPGADARLVVAKRLGGLARLLLGAAAEAAQGFFITLAKIAHIGLYVGLEFGIGGGDANVETAFRPGRADQQQRHEHQPGQSLDRSHGSNASTRERGRSVKSQSKCL
ncbi:hypothetical protein D9M71_361910 [compost metagenome]